MNFELQPSLKGKLIDLRPLKSSDFDGLYSVASDPLIWEQHPQSDRYKEDVFRGFFQGALDSKGALIVTESQNELPIGSSRFCGLDLENSEVEIGWTFLARSYWGGSYNKEMKMLMLQHAFKFVDNVVFCVGPENLRSQKAMEKIGGVRIASRINSFGQESVTYRITRAMFQAL